MHITICKNESQFDSTAAWRIIGQVLTKTDSVIGLSTGRTTKNMHMLVGNLWQQMPFNIAKVTFFGVDEVVNVPRNYKGACYQMLHDELIDLLGLNDNQLLMLPTQSDDFKKACSHYTPPFL